MSFLETLKARQAAAQTAATESASFEDTPFVTPDMTPVVVEPAAPVAPAAPEEVVVVTPDDVAVDPEADIEEGAGVEAMLDLLAAGESYGWSPALLSFADSQGLLAGTALESMSLENYSMEADGEEVGGEVAQGIGEKVKGWETKILGKITGLWDHVAAKFKKSEDEVEAAASKGVDEDRDTPVGTIPYGKIAAIIAGIAAAGAAIYVAVRHVNFAALQKPGAMDSAAKSIDTALTNVKKHIPWMTEGKALTKTSQYFTKKVTWSKGAFIPHIEKTVDLTKLEYFKSGAKMPLKKLGWTTSALNATRSGLSSAYKAVTDAVKGLYGAAKNPGAVVDKVAANPQAAAHTAGKAAVLGFVGSIVALVSWLLYNVVLKGANLVAGAVRKVTGGGSSTPAEA